MSSGSHADRVKIERCVGLYEIPSAFRKFPCLTEGSGHVDRM